MDESEGWIILCIFVGLGLYLFGWMLFSFYKIAKREIEKPNELHLEIARQYRLPREVRVRGNVHQPYDYWNDAGDGSGVNYVQMSDGSVRID